MDVIPGPAGDQPSHQPLYRVELRGDSLTRGEQHGRLLREPIARALDFYRWFYGDHLGIEVPEMRRRATRFFEPTAATSPALMQEYEGIAEGSRQRLDDIFMLSARYEITYERLKLGECSNVFVGSERSANGHPLLGMNWEWRPEVLDFRAVLIARCDDGPDHIVVTECGQPGKYGINEFGIVAIETGLGCSQNTSIGRDLFVVDIREMIARTTLDEARRVVHEHPPEATISFFVADDSGVAFNLEASPAGVTELRMDSDQIRWHTNHCLLTDEPCTFEDSFVRGSRWQELIAQQQRVSREMVGDWLADRENGYNAICKAPAPGLRDTATWLQTLCSIVFDPVERAVWVSDGLSSEKPYVRTGL